MNNVNDVNVLKLLSSMLKLFQNYTQEEVIFALKLYARYTVEKELKGGDIECNTGEK